MTEALVSPKPGHRPAAQPLLVASNVRKHYGGVEVLKGISLTVNSGEVMCLLGPSGSGKSTFLRCINHLERIDGGRISVAGDLIGYAQRQDRIFEMSPREVARQRRGIGMVFQRFNLFPHMTALENIWAAPDHLLPRKRDVVPICPSRPNRPSPCEL